MLSHAIEQAEPAPSEDQIAQFRGQLVTLRQNAQVLNEPLRCRVLRDLDDLISLFDGPVAGRIVKKRADSLAGAYMSDFLKDPERMTALVGVSLALALCVAVVTGQGITAAAVLGAQIWFNKVWGPSTSETVRQLLGAPQKELEAAPSAAADTSDSKDPDDQHADEL